MSIVDFLLGRPLASSEEGEEKIGWLRGVPVFGLDALASAAYGPEAALTILIPAGLAGLAYIVPLSVTIIVLLAIVFFSYRQTIAAYPQGGGSYTVAHQNLGRFPGLLAGAALLIDYTLDAAVGISAGIGALTSAIPALHSRTLTLCLIALVLLTFANLRGVRENGAIFLAPTCLFVGSLAIALAIGLAKAFSSGGNPHPLVPPPVPTATMATVSLWLLLRSFASGCTALTGVEAVSNGAQAFREDRVKNAQRTLGVIIAILAVLLAGIAYLVRVYKIVATDPNGNSYQSVLSMLLGAIAGRGAFYYVAMASVLLILIFSANTAFAGFPRVCRFIAEDGYLPVSFANRGRRLVYSEGIIVLAIFTGGLLIIFGGITDHLIPLFAVGAFLAFTMSQAGMVAHWKREGGAGAARSIFINGLGATATGLTVVIIILAKFTEGAWITLIAIPGLITLMYGIHRHYNRMISEIATNAPLDPVKEPDPVVVLPVLNWNRISKQALQFAFVLSSDVKILHVSEENKQDDLSKHWTEYVEKPAREGCLGVPELIFLNSPYRFVINPIVDYVTKLAGEYPNRRIVTIVPDLIEKHWYHYFLHNQRNTLLKTRLLMEGNDRISVLNIPWHLQCD